MKKLPLMGAAMSALLMASLAQATPSNITIYDGQASGGTGVGSEDNETEPGTIHSDGWDLEAFGYDFSTKRLDVIGTFDFKNGAAANNKTYHSGAIFVGSGNTLPGANGWSYAYLLNFNNNTYALYNNFSIILPTDISASSPYSIIPNAASLATGSFTYLTGLANPDGFGLTVLDAANANLHNVIELSLGDLTILDDFWVHTTMECGNDDMNGHHTSVPDSGATIALLGLGLTGLGLVRRKLNFC